MITRSKGKILYGVIGLVLFLIFLYPGLTRSESPPTDILKIGNSQPLNRSWGVEVKRAYELCVDLINEEGGLAVGGKKYKIEMTLYDDKYSSELGRSMAERLVYKDKVKAIVGTTGSGPAVGSLPVIQSAKVPFFTSAHTEKVLDPKLKYVYATSTGRSVNALYSLILKAEPKIKTAVLAPVDMETGHALNEIAVKLLTIYGIKILETFSFPLSTRDYTPIATKVASLNPDFLVMPGFGNSGEQMGLVMKALNNARWHGVVFVTASPVVKDLVEVCPRGEAEGLYVPLTDFTTLPEPPPLAIKIRKAYEKKYGEWREVGPYWTLPIWFFAEAAKKAGSFEADEIDKAMAGLEIETTLGKAIMIKRPDLGNTKFVDTLIVSGLAKVKGTKAIFVSSMTAKESIKEIEKAYGFEGKWK